MSSTEASDSRKSLKQVERLFFILQHLHYHDYVTAGELAELCGTTERTIYRDMQQLESNGFYFTSHGKEGYQLIENLIPPSTRLSEDEFFAVALAPLLSQTVGTPEHPFHNAYRKALHKINTLLKGNTELLKMGRRLGERIRIHDRRMDEQQLTVTQQMIEAITADATIRCTYHTMHRDRLTERDMDPYYLVPREGHLYVIAYCHLRQGIRVFRLNRFRNIRLTGKTFVLPPDFDIDDFLANRWSIQADDTETTFKVLFSPAVARFIKEGEYYVDALITDEPDGAIIFQTTVKSAAEFMRWLRQYEPHVELLEPEEYRRQLRTEYKQLLQKYET